MRSVYGYYRYSVERFSYVYDIHHRIIREYFKDKPYNLLELNIVNGNGWEKLCSFLGLEIPQTEFPFVKFKKQL